MGLSGKGRRGKTAGAWVAKAVMKPLKKKKTLFTPKAEKGWKKNVSGYWKKQPANDFGVTGGGISKKDIPFSEEVLKGLLRFVPKTLPGPGQKKKRSRMAKTKVAAGRPMGPPKFRRVLDAAAGIGRVTQKLLSRYSKHVDLLDATQHMLDQARARLGERKVGCGFGYVCSPFEKFNKMPNTTPSSEIDSYDLVWIQWALMYVTDTNCVKFLRTVAGMLSKGGGIIVVKENITGRKEESYFEDSDDEDWQEDGSASSKPPVSCARADKDHEDLFERAGLEIVKKKKQWKDLGNDAVIMTYVLQPKKKA